MSELERIEALEREIRELKGLNIDGKKVYSFSKITDNELRDLVDIQKELDRDKFLNWFSNNIDISQELKEFFHQLVLENRDLIYDYSEEDLKVNLIVPILNRVKFKSFDNKVLLLLSDFWVYFFIYMVAKILDLYDFFSKLGKLKI